MKSYRISTSSSVTDSETGRTEHFCHQTGGFEGERPIDGRQDLNLQALSRIGHFNIYGVLGIVFAMLGLFLFWIPYVDLVFSLAAFILSLIGMRKNARALAVIGLVVSIVDIALAVGFVFFYGALFSWVGDWLNKLWNLWVSTH